MSEDNKLAVINYRIEKSKEAIIDARLAIDNSRYSNAQNRIYYSIFYIVSALSVKYGFSTSKHKQLLGWFNKNFVFNGLVNSNLSKIYKEAYDNRQESDYCDFIEIIKNDLEENYKKMLVFVEEVEKIIQA